MKICAAIACRVQSQRLFGKPLQMIEDKTILGHLIFQLKSCNSIDAIVLAIASGCGNEVFVDLSKEENVDYVFGDMHNVTERLVVAAESVKADQIVRVTSENPLIYKENLSELINSHLSGDCDYSSTKGLPDGTIVEIIKKDALVRSAREGTQRHRHHAATQYIFENQDKFKIFRAEPPAKLKRAEIRLTVDLPEDLMLFRKMYKEIYYPGKLVMVEEAVEYLDKHPEVNALNSWATSFFGDGRNWDYGRMWD